MPAFEPLGGMAVAHDVLEHWPNDDSTTGELLAFGAMLWVRGEDYFALSKSYNTNPFYHMKHELAKLLLKISRGEFVPLRHAPCQYRTNDYDIQKGIEELILEISIILRILEIPNENPATILTPETVGNVKSWLARGYNRAQRRYASVGRHELLDTFCFIEEQADKALRYATADATQLHVSIKPRFEVRVWDSEVWD